MTWSSLSSTKHCLARCSSFSSFRPWSGGSDALRHASANGVGLSVAPVTRMNSLACRYSTQAASGSPSLLQLSSAVQLAKNVQAVYASSSSDVFTTPLAITCGTTVRVKTLCAVCLEIKFFEYTHNVEFRTEVLSKSSP